MYEIERQDSEMDKKVTLKVELKVADMYEFLLRHAYTSVVGLVGVGISLIALVVLLLNFSNSDLQQRILLIVIASLFTIVNPIQLRLKARQQVSLNPMFKIPLEYEFTNAGVIVRQNEQQNELTWKDVYKVVETKRLVILYFSKATGFILPKEQMGDQKDTLLSMISDNVDKAKCKLK